MSLTGNKKRRDQFLLDFVPADFLCCIRNVCSGIFPEEICFLASFWVCYDKFLALLIFQSSIKLGDGFWDDL